MGQNESRPEGTADLQIEEAEVGRFKRDAGKWVFEEDIIDVFDDDEVENILKDGYLEFNNEKNRLETLRSDSGFDDGEEEEVEIFSEGDEETGDVENIDIDTPKSLSASQRVSGKLFLCDHVQMVHRSKQNPLGNKSKRCKFKGSSVEILRKHKDFFHSNALKKVDVERKQTDSENMFPCTDCDLIFSHEWKLKVSEIGDDNGSIQYFRLSKDDCHPKMNVFCCCLKSTNDI